AGNVQPRAVAIESLQRELLKQDQVLTYFKDIDRKDPAHAALQYFGTKGFFPDYYAKSKDKLDRATANHWLNLMWSRRPRTQGSAAAGDFTGAELKLSLGEAGARTSERIPDGPLTRGEVCRILYGVD